MLMIPVERQKVDVHNEYISIDALDQHRSILMMEVNSGMTYGLVSAFEFFGGHSIEVECSAFRSERCVEFSVLRAL